ncbi:conserved hypothetical protein [Chryseobacterium sp. 8AT]|nr:conserved hypothetical protein [Chryseobacterium sp. 8AT]
MEHSKIPYTSGFATKINTIPAYFLSSYLSFDAFYYRNFRSYYRFYWYS